MKQPTLLCNFQLLPWIYYCYYRRWEAPKEANVLILKVQRKTTQIFLSLSKFIDSTIGNILQSTASISNPFTEAHPRTNVNTLVRHYFITFTPEKQKALRESNFNVEIACFDT